MTTFNGMFVSLEISKYPLTEDYIAQVLAFIERLQGHPELEVLTNPMSTHIYGPLEVAFPVVQRAIAESFDGPAAAALVMKVLPGDVRDL